MGTINNISSFTGLQHACEMEAERLYKGVKGHMLANLYFEYVEKTTAAAGVVMPIGKWAAWRLNNKESFVLKQVYPQTRHY